MAKAPKKRGKVIPSQSKSKAKTRPKKMAVDPPKKQAMIPTYWIVPQTSPYTYNFVASAPALATASAPCTGCLCNPGEYPAGSLFVSNGDDSFDPIPPGDEGDYLRIVGGVPKWTP